MDAIHGVSAAEVAEQVFGPLFDSSPHPMVVYDHELRFAAVNRAFEELTQRDRSELIGELPDSARHTVADGGEQLANIVLGHIDECQTEIELHRSDGTRASAALVAQAVRDPDGTLRYIGMHLTDISDIKRSQRRLAARVRIGAVVRDASSRLAAEASGDVTAPFESLCRSISEEGTISAIAVAWTDVDGAAVVTVSAAGIEKTLRIPGSDAAAVLGLSKHPTAPSLDIPGWPDHSPSDVVIAGFGDEVSGWVGLVPADPMTNLEQIQQTLLAFVDQAAHRAARSALDARRMRLQAFVNETASNFLAHRFTGDRQEVLEDTLAGLVDIVAAHNAQFRTIDWDRMVSETTAEFVAEGHSRTDENFRVLDLNEPLYNDVAASVEPLSFEIPGMRGQTVSILSVPLVVEGLPTATLNLAGEVGRRWNDLEIEACRTIAGLMVQLQRRIDLERTLARRLNLGELVNRIASDFNDATADTAHAVIVDALASTADALDAPRIALWSHDVDTRVAVLDWVWERGVGGTSLADFVRIDVGAHADTATLFEAADPQMLEPDDIPTSFGDVPADLHLLYVPIARSGQARLALSVESWGAREWSNLDVETVEAVGRLFSQLTARVEAEQAMVNRLAIEDMTRGIATAMMNLTNRTSIEGIGDALTCLGHGLDLDRASLWTIDHRAAEVSCVAEWDHPDRANPPADKSMTLSPWLIAVTESEARVLEVAARDCELVAGDSSVALVAPLARTDERITGLLIFERIDGKPWTGEDHRAIDVVGNLLLQLGARLQAENYFTTAFENAPVGITLRDSDDRLLACNRAFEEFVGRTQDEILGTTVMGALQPEYTDTESEDREFRLERPDGSHVWGQVTEAKVRASSDRGDLWLRHITDITATRQAMEQLEYQAGHDDLTGLANRRVLMEQLRTCLQPIPQPTDAAVLLLDIDRFKVINDSLGHSAGDDVLRVVADRLRLAVRPNDVVCRLGGDEFVVLLRGPVSGIESAAVATRLLELLSEPIDVGPTRMFLSASIGIACPTADDQALDDVLRHADAAMYTAKSRGRSRFEVFDQRHRDALAHRIEVESELREAVAQGDLELHFQPEIELRSGRLLGAEALVRWPHPRLGLLTAGSFIDVAEETGQVVELGRLVLTRACQQAAAWNREFEHPLTMRVNLSAHQFDRPELVDEVRTALSTYGVAPEQLCLEITETAIMSHVDESLALLERLRTVGVQLAIDDFGTGFSSLAYLKRFPVDILKIDQTFVRGLGCDRDDEAIVRSVLSMAAALDLEVVAEGIESPEQRRILLEMGCHRGQGFGLARPAPAADLAELISAGGLDLHEMQPLR